MAEARPANQSAVVVHVHQNSLGHAHQLAHVLGLRGVPGLHGSLGCGIAGLGREGSRWPH